MRSQTRNEEFYSLNKISALKSKQAVTGEWRWYQTKWWSNYQEGGESAKMAPNFRLQFNRLFLLGVAFPFCISNYTPTRGCSVSWQKKQLEAPMGHGCSVSRLLGRSNARKGVGCWADRPLERASAACACAWMWAVRWAAEASAGRWRKHACRAWAWAARRAGLKGGPGAHFFCWGVHMWYLYADLY